MGVRQEENYRSEKGSFFWFSRLAEAAAAAAVEMFNLTGCQELARPSL